MIRNLRRILGWPYLLYAIGMSTAIITGMIWGPV